MRQFQLIFSFICITFLFSCKKKNEEIAEPSQPPLKRFHATIVYIQDSLTNFYEGYLAETLYLSKKNTIPESIYEYEYKNFVSKNCPVGVSSMSVAIDYAYTQKTADEEFGYYIKFNVSMYDKATNFPVNRWYMKYHIFHEGENGIINFKDL